MGASPTSRGSGTAQSMMGRKDLRGRATPTSSPTASAATDVRVTTDPVSVFAAGQQQRQGLEDQAAQERLATQTATDGRVTTALAPGSAINQSPTAGNSETRMAGEVFDQDKDRNGGPTRQERKLIKQSRPENYRDIHHAERLASRQNETNGWRRFKQGGPPGIDNGARLSSQATVQGAPNV